jgi:hypothetical protein
MIDLVFSEIFMSMDLKFNIYFSLIGHINDACLCLILGQTLSIFQISALLIQVKVYPACPCVSGYSKILDREIVGWFPQVLLNELGYLGGHQQEPQPTYLKTQRALIGLCSTMKTHLAATLSTSVK